MKTKYFIASYDRATEQPVELVPTDHSVFVALKEVLGTAFDQFGDSFQITVDIYKELHKKTSITLDLSKADYFIERCAA